jgi:RHS repeat-associated protein
VNNRYKSERSVLLLKSSVVIFGEELGVGVGGRTVSMGFGAADGVRQKFTSYERDTESTFDYAGARYYSANQGRFASVDPLMASASSKPTDLQPLHLRLQLAAYSDRSHRHVRHLPRRRPNRNGWRAIGNLFDE